MRGWITAAWRSDGVSDSGINVAEPGVGVAYSGGVGVGVGATRDSGAASEASAEAVGAESATESAGAPRSSKVPREGVSKTPRDVPRPVIRRLGLVEYEPTWRAMQRFTDERGPATPDEIWFLEHPPVFTLGMNASAAHVLAPGDIPVVQIDRGGQVTYHGPGQLVIYPLIDLRRSGLGIRDLVTALERSVIDLAAEYGVMAEARRSAPGVYVEGRKLASVGIRVRRGASYHGLAVNVSLDLEPFGRINPCGYEGLQMTQLADLGGAASVGVAIEALEPHLLRALGLS
jgi:lipoyl(octanoyl) transferase